MNVKQVIVMRKKFPIEENGQIVMRKLRTGKMVAQGAHAALAVVLNAMHQCDPADSGHEGNPSNSLSLFNMSPEWVAWIKGTFTKVCVGVETEEELLALYQQAKEAGLPCALITDSGFTEFNHIPTNTCIAIGPAESSKIDSITGNLELL
jgi:PTH2 family peptidyl-tRNA hydrolase